MARETGKDHARINLDIWGDDDWLDLTPPAQHLYFVLWTSPQLSYCGTGEWHPGKIAAKAKGWTPEAVDAAGIELSRELFLLIDISTEEFILRSWIKHDGLWKSPNMAVSMANARADLASRTLRSVIVHEVSKLKEREPERSSWQREAVIAMLKQKAIDPATLPPYPGRNPPSNPGANQWVNPPANPSVKGKPNPGANPPSNPGATPAPAPTSLTPTPTGSYVSRERHQDEPPHPNNPPPKFCPTHMPSGTLDNCGPCKQARIEHNDWLTKQSQEAQRRIEAHAAQLRAERQHQTQTRTDAIANCTLCDDDGYRLNPDNRPTGVVCDHIDRTETTRAGIAAVRAAAGKPHELDEGTD